MTYCDIPDELKKRDQWLMWDASNDAPRRPVWRDDWSVSWTDPDDWHSFDEAREAAAEKEEWGIGFVFAKSNDDFVRGVYGGLDIDGCIAETGGPKDWLPSFEKLIGDSDGYIEYSPSGTGFHVPIAGFEPPEWWRDVQLGDHEGVEAYGSKFFTFTGDRLQGAGQTVREYDDEVRDWLKDVYKSVNGDKPWEDEERLDDEKTVSAPSAATGNSREVADAVDRLDARDVADRTIVRKWNDNATTSGDNRAFIPTWGGADCNGTANIVDRDGWVDTGGPGAGGPLEMAAINMGELGHRQAEWGAVSGDLWGEAVDHLREIGFSIPAFEGDTGPTTAADEASADGGAVSKANSGGGNATAEMSIEDEVQSLVLRPVDPPEDFEGEEITNQVAIDRFVRILCDHLNFVRPRSDVRGWRDTLYVYDSDAGIYQPHGEDRARKESERLLGAFATNQRIREIVDKIARRTLTHSSELETKPHRLVVGNGILDLHKGELEPHDADEYHRTKLEVDYRPEAEPDRLDEFFHEVVADRDVPTLYQLIAHCLYKEYVAEKAGMLLGDGQNGKSVYLSVVEEFLGEFNVSHRALQEFDDNSFAANDLEGKLANIHPDMGDQMVRDLGTFKKLTGRDTMTADVKYESPITFENYATLLFAANRMPAMGEDTHALWRRWIYVNFPHTFDDQDPQAKDEVKKRVLMRELTTDEEFEGLLSRCVDEISEWWDGRDFFTQSHSAEEVREKMKRASEPIYDFAAVCLELADEDDYLPKEQVRKCYRAYAKAEGLPTKADNAFGEELLALRDYPIESGQRRINGQRERVYSGVQLSSRGRQVLGLDENNDDHQDDLSETSQLEQVVLTAARELEDESGAFEKEMIVGRVSTEMTISTAQTVWSDLVERGDIYDVPGEEGFRVS